jgi:predicted phosphodiesterase
MNGEVAYKFYNLLKNGMTLDEVKQLLNMSEVEVMGTIELCNIYGYQIDFVAHPTKGYVIKKLNNKKINKDIKPNMDELNHIKLCIVSDTHLGNIHQQLHLLNNVYEEAYKREIDTVLHCGDLVDGDYLSIRKEQGRQCFLFGFDQQCGYVVDMYPKIKGITTNFILGSHDETHYKNGQATVNNWISRCRDDMIYLGQDSAAININGVKIFMDHPGGGSAQALSYKPQKRIETLESDFKPKILLIGHYHKSYSFVYRNVRGIQVPCLCGKTQFQQKQGLSNVVGAYFLNIYSDNKGNIQYFEPEEILFRQNEFWDEAGKDKNKVKQLIIK